MPGMKAGTIKVLLRKKIKEWLNTIPDTTMRECFADNVIVTGGAITSYLLGEKPKDYDFYLRTYSSTLTAAIHYAHTFNRTNNIRGIPYDVKVREETIENCKGILEDRIVFFMQSAGVAAESQTAYQYFESAPESETREFSDSLTEAHVDELVNHPDLVVGSLDEELKGEKQKEPYRPIFLTDNAVSLANKVQLITRFYGSPTEIHNNFDFVHAMCYYDYRSDYLHLPQEALLAILTKSLIYKGSLYPIASIFRIRKFLNRGWRISAGQMLKIMWQINSLKLDDPKVLREQLLGVDQAYMQQILGQLRDLKPHEKIDGAYLMSVIDKIFDE